MTIAIDCKRLKAADDRSIMEAASVEAMPRACGGYCERSMVRHGRSVILPRKPSGMDRCTRQEFGIGRPYLDRDPPHVAPIEGKEIWRSPSGMKARRIGSTAKATQ